MSDKDLIAESRRLEGDYSDSHEVVTHMSVLADALEAATERARQAEAELRDMLRVDIPSLKAECDAAVAAVERVRAIHERDMVLRDYCSECSDFGSDQFPPGQMVEWPCPTVAALDGAPEPEVLPVEGEPSGDPHEMSEHSVVAYHEWRNILGRDHLSDDEGTAARIAFYAGWDHARAVTPEPDWEYGLRTRSKHDPARGFFSYAGDLETAWEMYGATYEHCTATIVRRRKAGPWLPVEGEKR